jgi:hypothetical protein
VQAWIDAHPEAEELSEEEINRIDADRERAEEEAFEDERQPGGPLWDAEHGRPYDDATSARLINESRYPELATEGGAGRGGGQPETAEPERGGEDGTYTGRCSGAIGMSNAVVGPAPGFDLAGPELSPVLEADLEAGPLRWQAMTAGPAGSRRRMSSPACTSGIRTAGPGATPRLPRPPGMSAATSSSTRQTVGLVATAPVPCCT